MNADRLREICLAKPGATEGHPFGPSALVMKVQGKMFALIAEDAAPPSISLKCDPGWATVLRETFPAVTAGYHLNKRHWNTVTMDGTVPDDDVIDWIDDSYDLVVAGLPRRLRDALRSEATDGFAARDDLGDGVAP